jgi:hypothetical protein
MSKNISLIILSVDNKLLVPSLWQLLHRCEYCHFQQAPSIQILIQILLALEFEMKIKINLYPSLFVALSLLSFSALFAQEIEEKIIIEPRMITDHQIVEFPETLVGVDCIIYRKHYGHHVEDQLMSGPVEDKRSKVDRNF